MPCHNFKFVVPNKIFLKKNGAEEREFKKARKTLRQIEHVYLKCERSILNLKNLC